ncbi:MAG: GntR family transcriptional regulator [Clostridiales bacterium]|nr:GntR family transcriptional regulator [Clostridiales bacterium]
MNIVISPKSEKPIYEQLYEQLSSQIMKGELPANYCLPSIRFVAKELNISVITVKKAWEMLESARLIYTRAGIGCFVSDLSEAHLKDKKYTAAKERISKDIDYYKSLGLTLDELIELIKDEYNKNKT